MMRTTLVDVFRAELSAVGPGIVREAPNAPADAPGVPGGQGALDDRDHVAAIVSVVVVRRDPDRDPVPDLAVI